MEELMATTLEFKLAQDRQTLEVRVAKESFKITAEELEGLMRELAFLRANMLPGVPNEAMTNLTIWSTVPCQRWQVAQDNDAPTQIRLFLQHLGFGWVWIPLSEANVSEMQHAMQTALRARPALS